MSVYTAGDIMISKIYRAGLATKLSTTLFKIAEVITQRKVERSSVLQPLMALTMISSLPTVLINLRFLEIALLNNIGLFQVTQANIVPKEPFLFPNTLRHGQKLA